MRRHSLLSAILFLVGSCGLFSLTGCHTGTQVENDEGGEIIIHEVPDDDDVEIEVDDDL